MQCNCLKYNYLIFRTPLKLKNADSRLTCLQRYIISYEKSWHRIKTLLYKLIFNVFAEFLLILSTLSTVNTHLKLL